MKKGTVWSREETIVAFYVYCMIPFSAANQNNPLIITYAKLLGRTPAALNMKIGNIGRLDPELKKRNITGLTHGAKMEETVWRAFEADREALVYEAEQILERLSETPMENAYLRVEEKDYSSDDKVKLVKTRVNQSFFRSSVLSAYNNACAITNMKINELLVASHIKPWATDKANRLNPHNGICLNSLHDKAFDQGLITINKKHRVIVSSKIKEFYANEYIDNVFKKYEGKNIVLPNKFSPSPEFLEYHNDVIFLS